MRPRGGDDAGDRTQEDDVGLHLTFHSATPAAHAGLVRVHSARLLQLSVVHSVRALSPAESARALVADVDVPNNNKRDNGGEHKEREREEECNGNDNNNGRPICVARILTHVPRARWLARVALHAPRTSSTQWLLRGATAHWPGRHGWVALADTQTAGRGRRGTSWISPSGSLALSVQLEMPLAALSSPSPTAGPASSTNAAGRLVFVQYVAAMAVVRAARALEWCCGDALRVKWPNDVVLAAGSGAGADRRFRKVAGVLCEASVSGRGMYDGGCASDGIGGGRGDSGVDVTVGVGINVTNAAPTACVARAPQEAPVYAREEFAGAFLDAFEDLYDELCGRGFAARLEGQYVNMWVHDGQQVRVGDGEDETGTVMGLAPNGWVRVMRDDWGAVQDLPPDTTSLDMHTGAMMDKDEAVRRKEGGVVKF